MRGDGFTAIPCNPDEFLIHEAVFVEWRIDAWDAPLER